MKPVFLIGYMGCGKTTLGEALAREMDLTYIDLDQLIEHENGMTITHRLAHHQPRAHYRTSALA